MLLVDDWRGVYRVWACDRMLGFSTNVLNRIATLSKTAGSMFSQEFQPKLRIFRVGLGKSSRPGVSIRVLRHEVDIFGRVMVFIHIFLLHSGPEFRVISPSNPHHTGHIVMSSTL